MMNNTWNITEDTIQPERLQYKEAVFTVGNGYMGCRGFFEEGGQGISNLGGIYIGGVFDLANRKEMPKDSTELVNTPNFYATKIIVDGEPISFQPDKISNYKRTLDMKKGLLERTFIWIGKNGNKIELFFQRFASIENVHLACLKVQITPLNCNPHIEIITRIDANVSNLNKISTEPLPIQPGQRHFQITKQSFNLIEIETLDTGIQVAEAQQVTLDCPSGKISGTYGEQEYGPTKKYELEAQEKTKYTLEKIVHIFTSRDSSLPPSDLAIRSLQKQYNYSNLLTEHINAWKKRWEICDISLGGHDKDKDQQAIRFAIFHLLQASTDKDDRISIGARGLSGEMYGGAVFWDTEIMMTPFFMLTTPKTARTQLKWRHNILPQSKQNAEKLWFKGAQYAWEAGPTGVEQTIENGGAFYAIHIVADVAHAIKQFWQATDDNDFMIDYGCEILIETARFWQSRVHFDKYKQAYTIVAVRGPNEYGNTVNNNLYTNMMAIENLKAAIKAVEFIQQTSPSTWESLAEKLEFQNSEITEWQAIANGIIKPYDKEKDLFLEDDNYLHRLPFDLTRGKPTKKRVIDSTLPYEALTLYQLTKQADIVKLINLLPNHFTNKQKRIAWEYYEPRTAHDSSLSYSPYATLAAQLDKPQQAINYFRESAYSDLDNLKLNTISGLHFANFGGTWQSVIFGFAGLKLNDNKITINPKIPEQWKRLNFKIQYKGWLLKIHASNTITTIEIEQSGHTNILAILPDKKIPLIPTDTTANNLSCSRPAHLDTQN